MTSLTPMLQQYRSIKQQHTDAILFFRMGDFYEMFYEDAYVASKVLDIALTSRDKNRDSGVPMCGVPWHSADFYIAKLVKAGEGALLEAHAQRDEQHNRGGADGDAHRRQDHPGAHTA